MSADASIRSERRIWGSFARWAALCPILYNALESYKLGCPGEAELVPFLGLLLPLLQPEVPGNPTVVLVVVKLDEVHPNVDQFFRIEQGEAKFVFNEKRERSVRDGDAVVVPAGTYHNVIRE